MASLASQLRLALRLLWRDLKAGEIRLLALALMLAVAAVTAVGFFTDRVHQALARESHQLLGADLLLVADAPWSAEISAEAGRRGLKVAETWTFPSMVSQGEKVQLVEVKAVSSGYPLRGQVQVAPGRSQPGIDAEGIPAASRAWADERLLISLGLGLGQDLALGKQHFKLDALITLEPDRSSNFFGVAPRLMINLADVAATGLIQPGARVAYRLLVAGEDQGVDDFRQWLQPRLGRGQRLEDVSNARPEIRSALERAQRFLGLASLLTVVLAVVVVVLAAKRYVRRHLDACAVMRCLGATQGQLMLLHMTKLLVLGLGVGCLGALGGYLGHFVLHGFLSEFVTTQLPPPSLRPWGQGLFLAVLLLLAFVGPPLLQLSRVSTLRVLRRETGLPRLPALAAYGLGTGLLLALMFWVAGDKKLGLYVVLGLIVALGLFALLAWVSIQALCRCFEPRGWGWQRGLAALGQRPWANSLQVVALALGLLAMVLLTVTRGELMGAWERSVPADAPNRFVVNIQPEQRQAFLRFMAERQLPVALAPMIRGRLQGIDGHAVSAADYPGDEQAQRLVEREFNLSWRDDLPEGNRVVAGRWFAPGETGVASVEEGLASKLGIGLGSELVFNIAGQEKVLRVVGLRKLNWDSMRVNFFVLTPRADLQDEPASDITAFHLAESQGQVPVDLVQAFPNLTVIDIGAILTQLRRVVGQVSQAVQFIFLFTLAAGLIVLYAALVSAFAERRYELALLRALGASRSQLRQALLAELAAVGALAGVLAGGGALVLGQVLGRQLFSLEMPWNLAVLPFSMASGCLLAWGVGAWSVRELLAVSPLQVLREGE